VADRQEDLVVGDQVSAALGVDAGCVADVVTIRLQYRTIGYSAFQTKSSGVSAFVLKGRL
jgi:hypothetical protein